MIFEWSREIKCDYMLYEYVFLFILEVNEYNTQSCFSLEFNVLWVEWIYVLMVNDYYSSFQYEWIYVWNLEIFPLPSYQT
jgi:hypothetical protein